MSTLSIHVNLKHEYKLTTTSYIVSSSRKAHLLFQPLKNLYNNNNILHEYRKQHSREIITLSHNNFMSSVIKSNISKTKSKSKCMSLQEKFS